MIWLEQIALGERAEAAGDFLSAAAAYRTVTLLPDARAAAEAFFRLGRVTWRQGRFDGALSAFESAKSIAAGQTDTEMLARIDNGIGAVYYARGDYTSARRAYADASANTSDAAMRGKVILNLGVIENIEGNLNLALERYQEAYALFVADGDMASATLAIHNRGMVEADLGLWDEADHSFTHALALAGEAGNQEMIAKTLVNRCEVLVERAGFAEAVEHCDRALVIYADVGDEVGRAEALRWRGHALGRDGDLAAAERNVSEALHIAVRAEVRLLEAEVARDFGVIRGLLGDRASSDKMLNRALVIFEALRAAPDVADVRTLLARPAESRTLARTASAPTG